MKRRKVRIDLKNCFGGEFKSLFLSSLKSEKIERGLEHNVELCEALELDTLL